MIILCLCFVPGVYSKSIGEAVWDVVFGKPHKISIKQSDTYIKDRITAYFYNKYLHRQSNDELDRIYAKATAQIYLTQEQVNAIEGEVKAVVQIFSNYETVPKQFNFKLPKYVQAKKITWSQVSEYIEEYVKQRFNINYDPKEMPNYLQMDYNIKVRARQEALAGCTNDGLQIIDDLIWADTLNNIIEQELYLLVQ